MIVVQAQHSKANTFAMLHIAAIAFTWNLSRNLEPKQLRELALRMADNRILQENPIADAKHLHKLNMH